MDSIKNQIELPLLNLPDYNPELYRKDDKLWVFDPIRKKQLVLTLEEWVRQHWINFLVNHQNYPKGLFALEKGLKYNQLQKRTDLVIWDKMGAPYLLLVSTTKSLSLLI